SARRRARRGKRAAGERGRGETVGIDSPGWAKNTLGGKGGDTLRDDASRFGQALEFARQKTVETTTLDQLMAEYGSPYFVKIDVEGFEPQVIRGLKRPVPFLSFEVNLPEFRAEGLECVEQLAKVSGEGAFNYAIDCQQCLALKPWVDAKTLAGVLQACDAPSIEVFWTTKTVGSSD